MTVNIFESNHFALWGIFVILLTWLAQWCVASGARSSLPGIVPGKFDESLGHGSFAFRAHRTFMNSIENVPALLGAAFLAILAGANAQWTGVIVWIFAVSRIAHMALYYTISTEQNPSPRSYFFLIGLAANVALLILCAIALA